MSDPLIDAMVRVGALRFGRFTLTSGRQSSYYVDVKTASSHPEVLRLLSGRMAALVPEGTDLVAGVELGGVPLATALSLETGLPLLIIRKERREHGTGRQIEGSFEPGARAVLVEDVVTSGGSVVKAVSTLRDAGLVVDSVLAVVDREEGGLEAVAPLGVALHPLLTAKDLIAAGEGERGDRP